ncbi:MAG TPA: TonB-dependent receptor [Steroidobacteraceae bacterium]
MQIRETLRPALVALAASFSISAYAIADSPRQFNIPPGDLAAALDALARQAGIELMYSSAQVKGLHTDGLQGEYTAEEAATLLLSGTRLKLKVHKSGALLIAADGAGASEVPANSVTGAQEPSASEHRSSFWSRLRLAQSGSVSASMVDTQRAAAAGEQETAAKVELEEIVVTGTHIRGVNTPASALQVYTREEIDRAGFGSIQDFIQRLPLNFNGGAAEDTMFSGGTGVDNRVGGTGVNLRGLGNDSTLTLINGHRVAPANVHGNFVDVSLIPLSAVERVEIVADGASAIYGADAVGGVVNFVLRKDFEGAETRLRYGDVSGSSSREMQVGQTLGYANDRTSALLTYEYFDRTPLSAADRSFSREAEQPFNLVPEQRRHAGLVSLNHQFPNGASLFSDLTFAHRETATDTAGVGFIQQYPAEVDAYGGTLGSRFRITPELQAEVSATYTENRTSAQTYNDLNPVPAADRRVRTRLLSVDSKIDGSLAQIRSGAIRFAAGLQYREEEYDFRELISGSTYRPDRDVKAGFIELRVPLPENMELTLSDRYEDYSDFGSKNSPQLGLTWQAAPSLKLRGTYGRSFKAPLFTQLNPMAFVYAWSLFDPGTGGTANALIHSGGNPDLSPETAKTWTVGLDFRDPSASALTFSLTYYNIDFGDRIANPQVSFDIWNDALRLEGVLGPRIIQRNVPADVIAELASLPTFFDFFGIDLATISTVVDARDQNLSSVKTSGVDFSAGYRTGAVQLGVDGTYVVRFDTRFTSTAPEVELLNTVYNPVDLRARAHIAIALRDFDIAAYFNYTDGYKDVRADQTASVASWSTIDLTASWRPQARESSWLSDTVISASITNLLDRNPPFVDNPLFPLYFDGANADPIGRVCSITLLKRW